ncbi:hypothetical protein [Embleya sp. NPDC020630]|uniref:hypothetical protein n=1 Tax=Embleya sp. NPDC020630 TaxID=3363979 RepID=UPI00379A8726
MTVEYVRGLDVFRHHCPIDVCPWHHDEPTGGGPRRFAVDRRPDGTLDIGGAINRDVAERAQRREAIVEAHAETHTAMEWVTEVRRLRRALAVAEQESWRP